MFKWLCVCVSGMVCVRVGVCWWAYVYDGVCVWVDMKEERVRKRETATIETFGKVEKRCELGKF